MDVSRLQGLGAGQRMAAWAGCSRLRCRAGRRRRATLLAPRHFQAAGFPQLVSSSPARLPASLPARPPACRLSAALACVTRWDLRRRRRSSELELSMGEGCWRAGRCQHDGSCSHRRFGLAGMPPARHVPASCWHDACTCRRPRRRCSHPGGPQPLPALQRHALLRPYQQGGEGGPRGRPQTAAAKPLSGRFLRAGEARPACSAPLRPAGLAVSVRPCPRVGIAVAAAAPCMTLAPRGMPACCLPVPTVARGAGRLYRPRRRGCQAQAGPLRRSRQAQPRACQPTAATGASQRGRPPAASKPCIPVAAPPRHGGGTLTPVTLPCAPFLANLSTCLICAHIGASSPARHAYRQPLQCSWCPRSTCLCATDFLVLSQ